MSVDQAGILGVPVKVKAQKRVWEKEKGRRVPAYTH